MRRNSTLAGLALAATVANAAADEGMWTFDNFPSALLKQRYDVTIDQAWLDRARRGIVRLTPGGQAELVISGPNLVGLAFVAGGVVLATTNAVYHLRWAVAGLRLLP